MNCRIPLCQSPNSSSVPQIGRHRQQSHEERVEQRPARLVPAGDFDARERPLPRDGSRGAQVVEAAARRLALETGARFRDGHEGYAHLHVHLRHRAKARDGAAMRTAGAAAGLRPGRVADELARNRPVEARAEEDGIREVMPPAAAEVAAADQLVVANPLDEAADASAGVAAGLVVLELDDGSGVDQHVGLGARREAVAVDAGSRRGGQLRADAALRQRDGIVPRRGRLVPRGRRARLPAGRPGERQHADVAVAATAPRARDVRVREVLDRAVAAVAVRAPLAVQRVGGELDEPQRQTGTRQAVGRPIDADQRIDVVEVHRAEIC